MNDKQTKEKVLVTGGAGFIGSHVAEHLISSGHDVVVVDDLSGGFGENVPEGADFIEGDITDTKLVEDAFDKHTFDYVFHLAAYAAEGLSHFIKHFNYENNLLGSVNLINASVNQGVKCFVFTSSIAVYGEGQVPMTEDMIPTPEDPYGIAKYAVEMDLRSSKEMFGMDYIIFRPHNVYGEGQNIGDKYRNVVGIFMNQVMNDQPMTIFGDGEQERAFTHIDDVAPLIARSVENKNIYNNVYNIGADKAYSVNDLAQIVADAMEVECDVKHLKERNEVKVAYADHSKLRSDFNFEPKVSLKEGVERMARWAKKVGSRAGNEFGNIEISKNLPPSWNKKK